MDCYVHWLTVHFMDLLRTLLYPQHLLVFPVRVFTGKNYTRSGKHFFSTKSIQFIKDLSVSADIQVKAIQEISNQSKVSEVTKSFFGTMCMNLIYLFSKWIICYLVLWTWFIFWSCYFKYVSLFFPSCLLEYLVWEK